MKRAALICTALFLGACAGVNMRSPAPGFLYSDVSFSNNVTSNQAGNRLGEACTSSILGLVSSGDASIEAARRNGGISIVSAIDESFLNYAGIYSKSCTLVRGR